MDNIIVNATGAPKPIRQKESWEIYARLDRWYYAILLLIKVLVLDVLVDGSFGGSIYNGTYATGTYTGVLASTLPGRGAEYGGISYYYPGNDKANGTVQVQNNGGCSNRRMIYDDGIIFDGVTADGKAQ